MKNYQLALKARYYLILNGIRNCGVVASRCIEHYFRPTIILTESNGIATGSARSVEGFDIHTALDKCSDLLLQYGGHACSRYFFGIR